MRLLIVGATGILGQSRMIQLKTNYWDLTEAEEQADILAKTIRAFRG